MSLPIAPAHKLVARILDAALGVRGTDAVIISSSITSTTIIGTGTGTGGCWVSMRE